MGNCSRQSTPSEQVMSNIVSIIRSMDKMLWYTSGGHYGGTSYADMKEDADLVCGHLQRMLEEYKAETLNACGADTARAPALKQELNASEAIGIAG